MISAQNPDRLHRGGDGREVCESRGRGAAKGDGDERRMRLGWGGVEKKLDKQNAGQALKD